MWHTEMHKQNVASWGTKEMYKCIVSGVSGVALVVQVQTLHFSINEVGHSGYSYIKNRAEG